VRPAWFDARHAHAGGTLAVMATPACRPHAEKLAGWTLQRLPEPGGGLRRQAVRRPLHAAAPDRRRRHVDDPRGSRRDPRRARRRQDHARRLPSDPVDRFRREAHVLAALSHEHIARIIDRQDPEEGPRFLVTEYIDGLDLGVLRRRGPLPAAVVLQIGLQVSAALAYVHAAGVIHRDIKPSNLMLVRHPGGDIFVKVIDFGIAKLERGSELAAGQRPARGPPGDPRRRRPRHGALLVRRRGPAPRRLRARADARGAAHRRGADVNANRRPRGRASRPRAVIKAALPPRSTMDHCHGAPREVRGRDPRPRGEAERRAYVVGRALTDRPAPPPSQARRRASPGATSSAASSAQGGMGRVQLVRHRAPAARRAQDDPPALRRHDKNLEARFRREGRALAAIEHIGAPLSSTRAAA
jgi:hypothetical protein